MHSLKSNEILSDKKINTLPRSLALEIELSNWGSFDGVLRKLPTKQQTWFQVNTAKVFDRSVTSEHELVISPSSGDDFVKTVALISHVLSKANAKVDDTCGLHVHVNASEFDSLAIRNILWIWDHYRPTMAGKLFETARLDSPYCKDTTAWLGTDNLVTLGRIKNPKVLRAAITFIMAVGAAYFGSMTGSSIASSHENITTLNRRKIVQMFPNCVTSFGDFYPRLGLKSILNWIVENQITSVSELINNNFDAVRNHYNAIRYSSVNLASLYYRGSLEFRVKEGTLDPEELLMWPLFVGWLTHVASNESFYKLRKLTNALSLVQFVKYQDTKGTRLFPEAIANWIEKKLG